MDLPEEIVADPEEAFRQIAGRHVRAAYQLAWAILGDEGEAEDAAREAFTSAWRQRFTLHDPVLFDAWFSRILVNGCRDRLRRRPRTWHPAIDSEPLVEDQPDSAIDTAERQVLHREVGRLDPDGRLVVVLRYWKDMPVEEIASVTGMPAGMVNSRLRGSIARLRAALERAR
jgi:RNA polymerase sigma factor (sigma-70 family)